MAKPTLTLAFYAATTIGIVIGVNALLSNDDTQGITGPDSNILMTQHQDFYDKVQDAYKADMPQNEMAMLVASLITSPPENEKSMNSHIDILIGAAAKNADHTSLSTVMSILPYNAEHIEIAMDNAALKGDTDTINYLANRSKSFSTNTENSDAIVQIVAQTDNKKALVSAISKFNYSPRAIETMILRANSRGANGTVLTIIENSPDFSDDSNFNGDMIIGSIAHTGDPDMLKMAMTKFNYSPDILSVIIDNANQTGDSSTILTIIENSSDFSSDPDFKGDKIIENVANTSDPDMLKMAMTKFNYNHEALDNALTTAFKKSQETGKHLKEVIDKIKSPSGKKVNTQKIKF